MHTINRFLIIRNPDDTYRIECKFIVYREKFGHHPTFLPQNEERGKREGFNTKFWFLIEDSLSLDDAQEHSKEYENKYSDLIYDIENDDSRWNEFPFKNCEITYSS